MNIDAIKALAELINAYGLSSLEFSEGDTRIRLEKGNTSQPNQHPLDTTAGPSAVSADTASDTLSVDFNRLIEVKSPLVGVFYSAPSPDSEPFVSIGTKVKKGDTLCLVETMKLVNEITAEQDGEIADICIKNGDIVEFKQVLFKMF